MNMKAVIERQAGLDLRQAEIVALLLANNGADSPSKRPRISGVQTQTNAVYTCDAVIVATGTYMESRIIIGASSYPGGPDGLFPSHGLAASIREAGLPMQRFKTGTPARINRHSVNFSVMSRQDGDDQVVPFSFENESYLENSEFLTDQVPCHLTYTAPETRSLILQNIGRSPLFSGTIEGVGPRYCPSIEDKFVKFPDKERHQVFIEPTGRDTDELYVQGLSSSMPEEIQLGMLRSVQGLEQARIMRSAYAIEYDCLDPTGLEPTLAAKSADGLFFAGQVNGTSGYEEAAAQGLIAGINAARQQMGEQPIILDRSQAYIGVLIDDLVTKGTSEPYRMMTARAEYRLLLRQDNADSRLTPLGYAIGLITEERHQRFQTKEQQIRSEIDRCNRLSFKPIAAVNDILESLGSARMSNPATLAELLRRPEITYDALAPLDPERPMLPLPVRQSVEIALKYEGYIRLEEDRIRRFHKLEGREIPESINYDAISGLRIEARQKLKRIRPGSVGQAARISGVSPADVSILLVYLDAWRRSDRHE